jgi:hypothetical protein
MWFTIARSCDLLVPDHVMYYCQMTFEQLRQIPVLFGTLQYDGDWLIDYLVFCVPLKNISLIWRRHHCRWREAKFRPMLGAQGLWAGRDLYRATHAVRDTGPQFFRSHPKDRPNQSPFTTRMGMRRIYSNPDPHRVIDTFCDAKISLSILSLLFHFKIANNSKNI